MAPEFVLSSGTDHNHNLGQVLAKVRQPGLVLIFFFAPHMYREG